MGVANGEIIRIKVDFTPVLVARIKKYRKMQLTGLTNLGKPIAIMANMPDINDKITSFKMSLELYQKLKVEAARLKIRHVNTLVVLIIEDELKKRGVELSSKDYEEIAKQVRKNEQRRAARNFERSSGKVR